jgi:hypothetical protein
VQLGFLHANDGIDFFNGHVLLWFFPLRAVLVITSRARLLFTTKQSANKRRNKPKNSKLVVQTMETVILVVLTMFDLEKTKAKREKKNEKGEKISSTKAFFFFGLLVELMEWWWAFVVGEWDTVVVRSFGQTEEKHLVPEGV